MSDDEELLARLRLAPESCFHVDLYWRYEGDVRFVEIYGRGTVDWEPGFYVHRNTHGAVNIHVVVRESVISSVTVAACLARFVALSVDEKRLQHGLKKMGDL